jgi:hypothetical protein
LSYLSYPRLHFAGRFQADPSTVNNDPEHFDDARFVAGYQLRGGAGGRRTDGGIPAAAAPGGWAAAR